MMNREKILKWMIYMAGIVCLYAFIAIRSLPLFNAVLKEKMVPGYWDKTKYGELYYFNFVRHFKEEGLPPAQKKFQDKSKQASLNDAEMIVFGDSYFDFSRHKQFPERLCDTMHIKVHFYHGDFPLAVLAKNHYHSKKPKILLYERVERYIPMAFENENTADYEVDNRSEFRKTMGNIKDKIFYKRSEELFDALLKRSIFTTGIYSFISTLKFDLFKYISPLTPVYSPGKKDPWIFYHDQTNKEKTSFYYHHTKKEMNDYCDHMADLAKKLKEEYNIRLIYLPLPAKYTLYHGFVNDDEYNQFLPDLYKGLKERGVEFINVYDDFRNADEILFYRTDSHWNEKGIQIAFNKTLEYFKNDSILKEYFNPVLH
jgi:hypothetical protein